jgi:hypothetical protein
MTMNTDLWRGVRGRKQRRVSDPGHAPPHSLLHGVSSYVLRLPQLPDFVA